MIRDFDDRQFAAISTVGALLAGAVAVGLALLIGSVWMWLLGLPNIHATLWGWLSTRDAHGRWGVGKLPIGYVVGVVTAYLLYQACELVAWGYRAFADAMRR